MAESIRQRIERNAANRDDLMLAWARQQLVPRDEHEAAVAEAVERAARRLEEAAARHRELEQQCVEQDGKEIHRYLADQYEHEAAAIRQQENSETAATSSASRSRT